MSRKNFKTKGFSYHIVKDADVINHIEKQINQSSYIWNLVRKDINKPDDIELIIKQYVDKLLNNKNIRFNDKKENNISPCDIDQLLGIKVK